jgi:hypothetical protein
MVKPLPGSRVEVNPVAILDERGRGGKEMPMYIEFCDFLCSLCGMLSFPTSQYFLMLRQCHEKYCVGVFIYLIIVSCS